MGERFYGEFLAGQLQSLDIALVRSLIDENNIGSPGMKSNSLPAEAPFVLHGFRNLVSVVNAAADDLADKDQTEHLFSSWKIPEIDEMRPVKCQTTYIDVDDSGPMPIAIWGMSCRFPGGANNPEEMFRLYERQGGTFPRRRPVHASFFNVNPNEAKVCLSASIAYTDKDLIIPSPWTLERECISKVPTKPLGTVSDTASLFSASGAATSDLVGSDTAVYDGAFNDDYGGIMDRDPRINPLYKVTGLGSSMLSNRISHWFDLRGPSVTMDTACSASSAALHSACENLRAGIRICETL
ncbi:MAG: hypothetical protein Q9209_007830 [Squamulea sp. 1 TL-2023]